MILTRELQVVTRAVFGSNNHQGKEGAQDRSLRPYGALAQRSTASPVALLLITALSLAGCADRPQAQHNEAHEAHEPCVVPRGGFDCGDKEKQEDNFMRFEQQGHQLP